MFLKIGLFMVLAGVLLAAFTGNFFGFSRREREREKSMRERNFESKGADNEARSYLFYFDLNERLRKVWKGLVVLGVLIVVIDFVFGG